MFLEKLLQIIKRPNRNDPVVIECEKYRERGCSPEAADLVISEYSKRRITKEEALRLAEDLQYCSSIKELKKRFAVKERPDEKSREKESRLDSVFGAIYGDVIGRKYEGQKITDISDAVNDPFQPACGLTDDSVLTIATLRTPRYAKKTKYYGRRIGTGDICCMGSYPVMYNAYTRSYREMAKRFPDAGYGSRFIMWMMRGDEKPYGSLGNGSAMRISPVGAMYNDIDDVIEQAAVSAMATHNHIEGVKGAVVTAVCIWMARKGYSKKQIYEYMKKHYSYGDSAELFTDFSYEEASNRISRQIECAYSVPAAVISFYKSRDYMDAIRLSACVGYDTDTNACICGSIAGTYYGVPEEVKTVVVKKTEEIFGGNALMNEMLGDRIRELRIKKGVSAEKMAELMEMTPERYEGIEAGTRNIGLDVMLKAAKILNVTTEDITRVV